MHPLTELHQTLQVAAMLLDGAAGQIRDAKLLPAKPNIYKIGEALAAIFEIQNAIDKQAPGLQLEPKYEEPPKEVKLANRRLGEAFLAADALFEQGSSKEARDHLTNYATTETSEKHRNLALRQVGRYKERDGT